MVVYKGTNPHLKGVMMEFGRPPKQRKECANCGFHVSHPIHDTFKEGKLFGSDGHEYKPLGYMERNPLTRKSHL